MNFKLKSKEKSEKKKLSAGKRLCILFAVILLVFAVVNLAWLFSTYIPYKNWTADMEAVEVQADETTHFVQYKKTIDGNYYQIRIPSYFDFSGRLTVSNMEAAISYIDENGEVVDSEGLYITFYIWTHGFGDNTYGFLFLDAADDDFFEIIYVDSEMNYIIFETASDEERQADEMLLADNYDECKSLMDGAFDFWDINV